MLTGLSIPEDIFMETGVGGSPIEGGGVGSGGRK
jgi:hypothetical protein